MWYIVINQIRFCDRCKSATHWKEWNDKTNVKKKGSLLRLPDSCLYTSLDRRESGEKMKYKELSAWLSSLNCLRFSDVYCRESGRCRTLPFFCNICYYFTFPRFPSILISLKRVCYVITNRYIVMKIIKVSSIGNNVLRYN